MCIICEIHNVFPIDQNVTCVYILADCVGTTNILIMGPMFVGNVSAKLSTLNSFSLAMIKKLSLRLRSAGESKKTDRKKLKFQTTLNLKSFWCTHLYKVL